MGAVKKEVGNVYGRLTVIERDGILSGLVAWSCNCECGNTVTIRGTNLRSGHTKSCGCLHHDAVTSHGRCGGPEYEVWHGMKQRCTNDKHAMYSRYGGRGIEICDAWLGSFQSFYEDMGDRPEETTLDREDNDGNYEPSNCRWATKTEQVRNRCNTIYLEFENTVRTLMEWSTVTGINYNTLYTRLHNKWTTSEILTTKPRR